MANEPDLTIIVPGRAVSANARLGYNRHTGRKFLTKAAREWKEAVAWAAKLKYVDFLLSTPGYESLRPPLRVEVSVYGTRADGDNLLKLILDGLKEGIEVDDKHYADVQVRTTAKGLKAPYTRIDVWESAASTDEAA